MDNSIENLGEKRRCSTSQGHNNKKGSCLWVGLVNEDLNEETCSSCQEGLEEPREQRHSNDG
jgi:hypothetical protein